MIPAEQLQELFGSDNFLTGFHEEGTYRIDLRRSVNSCQMQQLTALLAVRGLSVQNWETYRIGNALILTVECVTGTGAAVQP